MATSASKDQFAYEVFLSFRGPDTRKGFTDHLYRALTNAGVRTFRDDDEIERFENITCELVKAIRGSKISVIIFSENFVSSKACLQEVETIWKHSQTSKQQQHRRHYILPIFYNVEPAELKQKARELGPDQHHWRDALIDVASLAGMPLNHRYESEFVDEIVEMVKSKLIPKLVKVGRQLIGRDLIVKEVNFWLSDVNQNVGIIVLCGMGGVGKTAISYNVYESNRERFHASSFTGSIREARKMPDGYVRIQRKLLQDLLRKPEKKIYDVEDGHRRIQFVLENRRVLLVLDDVDHKDQLDSILGMLINSYTPGTKIIITTRCLDLLTLHEHCKILRIETLDEEESLLLFSMHAFGRNSPPPEFLRYSKRIVSHCQGLPLALEVLGSSLSPKPVEIWQSVFAQLEVIPNNKILETLKISYDSLNYNEKKIFLDIACFFVGKDKNDVISILDGCYPYTALAVENLVYKNILSVGEDNNKLHMHQLMQDMGKQVIYEESNTISNHSRLWNHSNSFKILTCKTGSAKIEGLILDTKMLMETYNPTDTEVPYGHSVSFLKSKYRNRKMPNSLEIDAFRKMVNVRLLKLCYVQLNGSYDIFPKTLVWLCLRGFHLKSLPKEFPLEHIVSLDLRNSSLKTLWNETKVFIAMKFLNLSHSHKLSRTPNFFTVPNLEKLILKDCPCLIEIDESAASLQRLNSLNLKKCENLRMLPRKIHKIKSLEMLDISGCFNLVGLAEDLEQIKSLKVLLMDEIEANQLLSSVPSRNKFMLPCLGKQKTFSEISWGSLQNSLVVLSLRDNNLTNEYFPEDLSFPMLVELNIGGNQFRRLPHFVRKLGRLLKIDMSWCPKLEQIEWPPVNAKELIVSECRSLRQITHEADIVPNRITHGACMKLNYVEAGFKIESMGNVDPSMLQNIGFFEFETKKKAKVFMVNGIVWSRLHLPVQVIFEQDIFSSYLPGNEVPSYFSKLNVGSKISFTVPESTSSLQFKGMNMCMVYKFSTDMEAWPNTPLSIIFKNKSKGSATKYMPRCHGRYSDAEDEYLIWVTHWFQPAWANLFDERDEVEVEFSIYAGGEIKECGVNFLYNEQGKMDEYYQTLYSFWDSKLERTSYKLHQKLQSMKTNIKHGLEQMFSSLSPDGRKLSDEQIRDVIFRVMSDNGVGVNWVVGVYHGEEENNDHACSTSDNHERDEENKKNIQQE